VKIEPAKSGDDERNDEWRNVAQVRAPRSLDASRERSAAVRQPGCERRIR